MGQRLTFLDILGIHVEFIVYFRIVYLVHLGSKVALLRFLKFLIFPHLRITVTLVVLIYEALKLVSERTQVEHLGTPGYVFTYLKLNYVVIH